MAITLPGRELTTFFFICPPHNATLYLHPPCVNKTPNKTLHSSIKKRFERATRGLVRIHDAHRLPAKKRMGSTREEPIPESGQYGSIPTSHHCYGESKQIQVGRKIDAARLVVSDSWNSWSDQTLVLDHRNPRVLALPRSIALGHLTPLHRERLMKHLLLSIICLSSLLALPVFAQNQPLNPSQNELIRSLHAQAVDRRFRRNDRTSRHSRACGTITHLLLAKWSPDKPAPNMNSSRPFRKKSIIVTRQRASTSLSIWSLSRHRATN